MEITNNVRRSHVTVAVSESRAHLRDVQKQLNWFLWSSELCYGFALSSPDIRLQNDQQDVLESLKDIQSIAWYPNYQGAPKYRAKTSTFKEQLQKNTIYIYRSVLIAWYSYFEQYLEQRVRPYIDQKKRWGPLISSLHIEQLARTPFPVRPRAVLLADLIRLIRNEMVHNAFETITGIEHQKIRRWKDEAISCLTEKWHYHDPVSGVNDALKFVFGLANKQRELRDSGRELPLEHFYVLYAFSNLDKLAFEIEEALITSRKDETGRLIRPVQHVRRADLIVQEIESN